MDLGSSLFLRRVSWMAPVSTEEPLCSDRTSIVHFNRALRAPRSPFDFFQPLFSSSSSFSFLASSGGRCLEYLRGTSGGHQTPTRRPRIAKYKAEKATVIVPLSRNPTLCQEDKFVAAEYPAPELFEPRSY